MIIKFCFRVLKNLQKGGASYRAHKEMEICIGQLPGVTLELTPYEIRVYAANQMAQHPILNISTAIVRVG